MTDPNRAANYLRLTELPSNTFNVIEHLHRMADELRQEPASNNTDYNRTWAKTGLNGEVLTYTTNAPANPAYSLQGLAKGQKDTVSLSKGEQKITISRLPLQAGGHNTRIQTTIDGQTEDFTFTTNESQVVLGKPTIKQEDRIMNTLRAIYETPVQTPVRKWKKLT